MKQKIIKGRSFFNYAGLGICTLLLLSGNNVSAQTSPAKDTSDNTTTADKRPVKNTFESNWIIDNQSVMVPNKGTLEFDIQHRFGIVNNGYSDFYGVFAPANIRMGFSYVSVKNLQFGFGLCKDRMQLDLNGKYAIIKQTPGAIPVSVTYFGNIVTDTRSSSNFVAFGDRISYFDQLIVARKVSSKFSVQAAISLSHFNNVPGYIDADGIIRSSVKNDQFTLSFMGRYKLSNVMAILVDYDQPLTQNVTSNPHPNLAVALELTTSSHCFQIVVGNGQYLLPQNNALYNQNDFSKGQYLVGFNMTKLWSF